MAFGFVDAHAHPGEMTDPYPDYEDAGLILACSSRPQDWGRLERIDDSRLYKFYGVHPWYTDEWSPGIEGDLRARLSRTRCGIGEIGLDSKKGRIEDQIPVFKEQMAIAMEYDRPVEVHMVGCEDVMLSTLRDIRPTIPVILHGFNNEGYSKAFTGLGCYLSINPRILRRSDGRIQRLMSSMPKDRLLLETDAPFTPDGFSGMGDFVSRLSAACGTSAAELLSLSTENARRIVYG